MDLDATLLDDVLHHLRRVRGDTTDVEVKRAAGGLPENVGETLSAFANTPSGGLLILGVDEANDFAVTGLGDAATVSRGLVGVARTAVSPSPRVTVEIVDVEGSAVLMARVEPVLLAQRPALFRGRAYLRQGDGDHVMSEDDLRYLEAQKLIEATRVDHDLAPVPHATFEDLDPDLVSELIVSLRAGSPRLARMGDMDLLRSVGAVGQDGSPTLAGLYAVGRYPQGPCPQLTVTAAVRLPSSPYGARTQNLRRFEGPLPELLTDVTAWIEQNLAVRQAYDSAGHMRDVSEFPGRAVREAVANALVHRDLSPLTAAKGVDVRIDDRSLLVMNPGRLSSFTVDQLVAGPLTRAEVNRHLYRLATHLRTAQGTRVIEGEGGGILEIFRSLRERGLQRPQIFDNGVTVTAKLWRGPMFDPETEAWLTAEAPGRRLSAVQKRLLLGAREGERWEVGRIRREFSPLSVDEARAELQELVRWGLVDVSDDDARLRLAGAPRSVQEAAPSREGDSRPGRSVRRRNGDLILAVLEEGPAPLARLVTATGLTENQVRYALQGLSDAGRVRRHGGQGVRGTTYEAL